MACFSPEFSALPRLNKRELPFNSVKTGVFQPNPNLLYLLLFSFVYPINSGRDKPRTLVDPQFCSLLLMDRLYFCAR